MIVNRISTLNDSMIPLCKQHYMMQRYLILPLFDTTTILQRCYQLWLYHKLLKKPIKFDSMISYNIGFQHYIIQRYIQRYMIQW